MGELKIKIPDDREKKFREYAFKKDGYRKGALSSAAEKILSEIIKEEKNIKREDLFLKSAGSWKDIDADSLIKKIYESRTISTRKKVSLK